MEGLLSAQLLESSSQLTASESKAEDAFEKMRDAQKALIAAETDMRWVSADLTPFDGI